MSRILLYPRKAEWLFPLFTNISYIYVSKGISLFIPCIAITSFSLRSSKLSDKNPSSNHLSLKSHLAILVPSQVEDRGISLCCQQPALSDSMNGFAERKGLKYTSIKYKGRGQGEEAKGG